LSNPARAFESIANPFECRESDRSHRESRERAGMPRLTESAARCS